MKLLQRDIKRLIRRRGRKYARCTRFQISFEIRTPRHFRDGSGVFFSPAKDEIFLIDLLDAIPHHCMENHDLPGFRLKRVRINGKTVVSKGLLHAIKTHKDVGTHSKNNAGRR